MSDSTTPDTTPTPDATPAPDHAAELAAAKAQLAELTAWKTQQVADAEAAKRASMSEAEKLAADRAALDGERKALRDRSRKDALTRLGVLDKAHQWAPDVDPADPAGAAALEAWAKSNPELVKTPTPQSQPYDAPAGSPLAKLLSGGLKNSIINPKRAAELLSRSK